MGKALADSCNKGEGWAVPSETVRGVCVLSLKVGKQRVGAGGNERREKRRAKIRNQGDSSSQ